MSGSSGTSSRVDIECVDGFSTFASAFAQRSDVGLLSCSESSLANGATSVLLSASIVPKSIGTDVGNCRWNVDSMLLAFWHLVSFIGRQEEHVFRLSCTSNSDTARYDCTRCKWAWCSIHSVWFGVKRPFQINLIKQLTDIDLRLTHYWPGRPSCQVRVDWVHRVDRYQPF